MDKELKKLEKLAQSSDVVTEVITLIITLFHFLVKQCMMVYSWKAHTPFLHMAKHDKVVNDRYM